MSLRNGSYEQALADLAAERDEVVVMTAENRAAIRNLPGVLGERFIDVGICEQTMIGAAAGLALRGRVPVVHALATFLVLRAFEFIRTDVGIGGLPVKLVGYIPGFLSEGNGPTHQALEDVALMRGIPGMKVFCPADEEDLVVSLPEVLQDPSPCYIRFNSRKGSVPHEPFAFGRAEVLSQGGDVTLLTYGFLVEEALKAQALLAGQGVSVRLVHLRSLKPADEGAILASSGSPLVVTLEDHFETGGLYSLVAEVFLRHGVTARVLPLALPERWFVPAALGDVLGHEGFSAERIAAGIVAALREKEPHA
jgi:transketolase